MLGTVMHPALELPAHLSPPLQEKGSSSPPLQSTKQVCVQTKQHKGTLGAQGCRSMRSALLSHYHSTP